MGPNKLWPIVFVLVASLGLVSARMESHKKDPKQAWPPSQKSQASRPKCQLGNQTFPIGHRWHPELPLLGAQLCVTCECSLTFKASCYKPKVSCLRLDQVAGGCPEVPAFCADGRAPSKRRGACCATCESPDFTSTSSPERWKMVRPRNNSPKLNYESVKSSEALWLFRIIAREQNERVFISSVKSVPLCDQN